MSDTEDPASSAEPPTQEEIWTYLGMRHERGEIEHHWLDARREVKVFAKLKAPMAAARYKLQVTHKASGAVSVVPTPRFVEMEPDEDRRRRIIAEHRANEVAAEAWRVGKKVTAEAIDQTTIADLRAQLNRLPVARRRALLAIAIERLLVGRVVT